MMEIEAPVEGKASHSCLALAGACGLEGRVTLQSLLWQLITGLIKAFVGVGDAPDSR